LSTVIVFFFPKKHFDWLKFVDLGSSPVNSWYDEVSSYNYSNPVFSSETGHFTQVVWNNSVQFGIGIAFTTGDLKAKVVANYYPPGNYEDQFTANVFPANWDNLGGD